MEDGVVESIEDLNDQPLSIFARLHQADTRLPERLHHAYNLCMVLHDQILKILRNGIEHNQFACDFPVSNEMIESLESYEGHVLDWMRENDLTLERYSTIRLTTLSAIMADMLNNIFESIEMARKGKMTLAFTLLRKPIQENLFLIEEMILSAKDYAEKLEKSPKGLDGTRYASGNDEERLLAHSHRVGQILEETCSAEVFDPSYIARLRYDKSSKDSFDGVCNQSIHLFTTRSSIKTEAFNINFIFSGMRAVESQWDFYFSRLVYLLSYMHRILSFLAKEICPAPDNYIEYLDNVIAALTRLWFLNLPERYKNCEIINFADAAAGRLRNECSPKILNEIVRTGHFEE